MDVIVVAIVVVVFVVGLVVFGLVVVGGIVVVIVGHRNLNLKFGQNHVIISDVLLLFLSLFIVLILLLSNSSLRPRTRS